MRFWDSSGLVPLLVAQQQSERAQQLFRSDSEQVVWWAARVECASAISRLERERSLRPEAVSAALARLHAFARIWDEVQPTESLRRLAERLLRAHPLRAADALQLAAMTELAGDQARDLEVVCFDDRLAAAALREGFRVAA